jgi:hypothetical protein
LQYYFKQILGKLLEETEFDKGGMGNASNQYQKEVKSNDTTTPKPTLSDYGNY